MGLIFGPVVASRHPAPYWTPSGPLPTPARTAFSLLRSLLPYDVIRAAAGSRFGQGLEIIGRQGEGAGPDDHGLSIVALLVGATQRVPFIPLSCMIRTE